MYFVLNRKICVSADIARKKVYRERELRCLDCSCICVINQLFQYCINGRECQHGHPSARKNLRVVDELLSLIYIWVIN